MAIKYKLREGEDDGNYRNGFQAFPTITDFIGYL